MSDDLTLDIDGEKYVLRRGTAALRGGRPAGGRARWGAGARPPPRGRPAARVVARRAGAAVPWLDDVAPALLSEDARAALAEGDASDPALQAAGTGIVQAEVQRGRLPPP